MENNFESINSLSDFKEAAQTTLLKVSIGNIRALIGDLRMRQEMSNEVEDLSKKYKIKSLQHTVYEILPPLYDVEVMYMVMDALVKHDPDNQTPTMEAFKKVQGRLRLYDMKQQSFPAIIQVAFREGMRMSLYD